MHRPTPETFEAWNEEMSRKYNPDHYHNSKNPLLRFIEQKRTNTILRCLQIQKTDLVLDVGCGAGNMLEKIDAKRTGIDLSLTMINRAKRKLGSDVELLKMSADNMVFEKGSFDKIICSEVIEHLLNPHAVLQQMKRVLKMNGLTAVSIPNEALIETTKSTLRKCGCGFLMKNEGQTNLDEIENEWHVQYASLEKFHEWNKGIFPIVRIYRIPFAWLPFRYVFLLKNE